MRNSYFNLAFKIPSVHFYKYFEFAIKWVAFKSIYIAANIQFVKILICEWLQNFISNP